MHTTRREMLGAMAALAALPAIAKAQTPTFDYAKAIVIDGLGGPDDPAAEKDAVLLTPRGKSELLASGITAFQVTVGDVGNERANWDNTIGNIGHFGRMIAANPDVFVYARTAADIRAAKASGRIALVFGTQDTAMVGLDLDRLETLKGLGVRVVQLTYNLRNLSGDGSLEPNNAGLSKLGRATIERIEKEKMLLDLSHGGQRTIAEAIAAAKRPMTISHTGARALNDNPRNVWDAEMKACADKGGVIGIYFMPFLVANSKPKPADVVRHLVHAVNVCGEDHVGIGTDGGNSLRVVDAEMKKRMIEINNERQARGIAAPGEGPDVVTWVAGVDGPMRFKTLAGLLQKEGWTSARIEKILGGNVLRLYGDVWGG